MDLAGELSEGVLDLVLDLFFLVDCLLDEVSWCPLFLDAEEAEEDGPGEFFFRGGEGLRFLLALWSLSDSDVSNWLRSFSWSLSFKSVSRLGVGGLLFLDEDEDFFLLLMVL